MIAKLWPPLGCSPEEYAAYLHWQYQDEAPNAGTEFLNIIASPMPRLVRPATLNQNLGDSDLVFNAVVAADSPTTVTQVAKAMPFSRAKTARIMAELVNEGKIRRKPHPVNKQIHLYES